MIHVIASLRVKSGKAEDFFMVRIIETWEDLDALSNQIVVLEQSAFGKRDKI